MSSISRQQLEKWLNTIDIDCNSCLDIGGSQNPITKRLRSFKCDDYKILDLETPHECKEKPDIVCDLNYFITKEIGQYDIAFCIEVSEYWWNPIQSLQNIRSFLKENGILYLSTHFIYPVHNPVEQDYLRYTSRGVEKLLEETGFKIEEMKPRLLQTHIANIDGMRPANNYDKHDWQGALIKAIKI